MITNKISAQQGFTLVEFMVVMALISLAISMTVVNFKEANDSRVSTQTIADVKTIIAIGRKQYDPVAGYAGITELRIANDQAFPQRLCYLGNCPTGGIALDSIDAWTYIVGARGDGFYFNLGPLTNAECVELGSKMIHHVDIIYVTAYYNRSTGIPAFRSAVLATSRVRGASYYFYYGSGATAGVCRYTNNYMIFYVDYYN